MTSRLDVRVRGVYGESSLADGVGVLVDRGWPRGLATGRVGIGEWAMVVAPCTELRRWYGPDPGRFDRFRRC